MKHTFKWRNYVIFSSRILLLARANLHRKQMRPWSRPHLSNAQIKTLTENWNKSLYILYIFAKFCYFFEHAGLLFDNTTSCMNTCFLWTHATRTLWLEIAYYCQQSQHNYYIIWISGCHTLDLLFGNTNIFVQPASNTADIYHIHTFLSWLELTMH